VSDLLQAHTTHLLFIGFGLWRGWLAWRDLVQARASAAWPFADGEIIGGERQVEGYHDDGEAQLRTVITYRYPVGGTTYRGERVFFGDGIALRFAGPGRRRLAAYPVGSRVRVAYDPTSPDVAVLEPGSNNAVMLACAVSAAITLLGLYGLSSG